MRSPNKLQDVVIEEQDSESSLASEGESNSGHTSSKNNSRSVQKLNTKNKAVSTLPGISSNKLKV